jgi:hypothetical protein
MPISAGILAMLLLLSIVTATSILPGYEVKGKQCNNSNNNFNQINPDDSTTTCANQRQQQEQEDQQQQHRTNFNAHSSAGAHSPFVLPMPFP